MKPECRNFLAMKPLAALLLLVALLQSQELYVRRDAITFKADYHAPLDTMSMAQFWQQTAVHSEAVGRHRRRGDGGRARRAAIRCTTDGYREPR